MSGSGREALPDVGGVWEALPDVQEWSRYPTGCLGVAGWLSQKSGSGREALPDVQEWSRYPAGCLSVAGWPSRKSGSGREALPDVQENWEAIREA